MLLVKVRDIHSRYKELAGEGICQGIGNVILSNDTITESVELGVCCQGTREFCCH